MKPSPHQLSLFAGPRTGRQEYDEPHAPVPLNASVPEHEAPRLSTQHAAIMDALRDGPKTNLQLRLIADRFGARLEEMKRAGIAWDKRCVKPGVYEYRLTGEAAAE